MRETPQREQEIRDGKLLWSAFLSAAMLSIMLGLATVLFAIILTELTLLYRFAAIGISAVIILHAILVAQVLRTPSVVSSKVEAAIFVSGTGLVFLGGAAIAWAIYNGITAGDLEFFVIIRGLLIAAQGALPILLVRERSRLSV